MLQGTIFRCKKSIARIRIRAILGLFRNFCAFYKALVNIRLRSRSRRMAQQEVKAHQQSIRTMLPGNLGVNPPITPKGKSKRESSEMSSPDAIDLDRMNISDHESGHTLDLSQSLNWDNAPCSSSTQNYEQTLIALMKVRGKATRTFIHTLDLKRHLKEDIIPKGLRINLSCAAVAEDATLVQKRANAHISRTLF